MQNDSGMANTSGTAEVGTTANEPGFPLPAEMPPMPPSGPMAPPVAVDADDAMVGSGTQTPGIGQAPHTPSPRVSWRTARDRLIVGFVGLLAVLGIAGVLVQAFRTEAPPIEQSAAPVPVDEPLGLPGQRAVNAAIAPELALGLPVDNPEATGLVQEGRPVFDYGVLVPVELVHSQAQTTWNVAISAPEINRMADGGRTFAFDVTMELAFAPAGIGSARGADYYVVGGSTGERYLARFGEGCDPAAPKHFANDVHVGFHVRAAGCVSMPADDAIHADTAVVLDTRLGEVAVGRDGEVPMMAALDRSQLPTSVPFGQRRQVDFGDSVATGEWIVRSGQDEISSDTPAGFTDAWFDVGLQSENRGSISPSVYVLGGSTRRMHDVACGESQYGFAVLPSASRQVSACVRIPIEDLGHPDTRFGLVLAGRHLVFGG